MKQTILVVVAVLALPGALVAQAAGDAAQPPAAPNTPTFSMSYVSGMDHLVVKFTAADVEAAPKWSEDADSPPLSPKSAVESARRELATQFTDAEQWKVGSITLRPFGSHNDWFYIIELRTERKTRARIGDIVPSLVQVVVLLDGRVIKPVVAPRPPSLF